MTDPEESELQALKHWYGGAAGATCQLAERRILGTLLPTLYGLSLISIGLQATDEVLAASPTAHQFVLESAATPDDPTAADLLAWPTELPFPADSVDVVLLLHLLEFAPDPRAVLNEVQRVLSPEGHVVITGFSPLAPWCLARFVGSQWRHWSDERNGLRLISPTLVRGWLSRLGFQRLAMHSARFAPVGAARHVYWGGSYAVVGKKRVASLTPIRPKWRMRPQVVVAGVAERASGWSREQ